MSIAVLIGSRTDRMDSAHSDWDFIVRPSKVKQVIELFTKPGWKLREHYPIDASHSVATLSNSDRSKTIILEFELAYRGSSAEAILNFCDNDPTSDGYIVAPMSIMYIIRESHRYRDSVHFEKNMRALHAYCNGSIEITTGEKLKEIQKLREQETYSRPVISLNKSKSEFFSNDGVQYVYDHDSIHQAVAAASVPAFEKIATNGKEVYSSQAKFEKLSQHDKDLCVLEEAWVIALERGYLPFRKCITNPRYRNDGVGFDDDYMHALFKMALQKICTTLTSGWFREYASHNYIRLSNNTHSFLDAFLFVENTMDILKPHKSVL